MNESLFPFILIYKVCQVEDAKEESEDVIELLQGYFETAALNKHKTPHVLEGNDTESEGNVTGVRITDEYRRRSVGGSLISRENRARKRRTVIGGVRCCF